MKFLIVFFSTFFIFFSSLGQIDFPEDKVKATFSLEQIGCEAYVVAKVSVVPGWHINSNKLPAKSLSIPTQLNVNPTTGLSVVSGVIEPKPVIENNTEIDEILSYHKGSFILKRKILISSNKDLTISGSFSFQTCNEVKCLPEFTMKFSLQAKACTLSQEKIDSLKTITPIDTLVVSKNEKFQNTLSQNVADKKVVMNQPKKEESQKSMWIVFFLSFLSGFAALIMPCVFPMIPMTVTSFTNRSKNRAQGIKNALLYGLSIVLIHLLLGVLVVITGAGSLLNELSTNVYLNLFFFIMFFLFGLSFLGAFEIQLPSKWVNSADRRAEKGGATGIFFMALVLSLASFSCTGPILGSLLGNLSTIGGGKALMVGMFGFGLALALPFMLFALIPSMLNSLPKSGGWLNSVKVYLGFVEIGASFIYFSKADTTMQWFILQRELFIALWVAISIAMTIYMLGKIKLPHDSPVNNLSVGRTMVAVFTLAFAIYLFPGLWGAPLKLVNAYLPPPFYSESPKGFGGTTSANVQHNNIKVEGMEEGPLGLVAFKDYDKALAYAKEVDKPLFLDFTGWGCVNCRKMEQSVWGEPGILEKLRDDFVIVSLYVDERTELPISEQKTISVDGRDFEVKTVGNKWTAKQMQEYKTSSQPYYVIQTSEGIDVPVGSADYQNHSNPAVFKKWLEDGLKMAAVKSKK